MRILILALCFVFHALHVLADPFLKRVEWQKAVQTPEDHQRLAFFCSLYEKTNNEKTPLRGIPKVFHVIWLGPDPLPTTSIFSMQTWVDKHPGWQMKLWTDNPHSLSTPSWRVMDPDAFPLNECVEIYYNAESFEERSLILRYAILQSEGGVFIDHAMQCLSSLDSMSNGYDFFCGLEEPGPSIRSSSINPSCHLIASSPHHPILATTQQWLMAHWNRFEDWFPGTDASSISNRVVHRSAGALSNGIEMAALQDGRKDTVFPPDFFSSSNRSTARYTILPPNSLFGQRLQQSQTKEKMQEAFAAIRTQLRLCIYLIIALAALNLFLVVIILRLSGKRKGK